MSSSDDEKDDDDECPVCFRTLADTIRTRAPCGHEICLACLLALKPPLRCVLCRADLSPHVPLHTVRRVPALEPYAVAPPDPTERATLSLANALVDRSLRIEITRQQDEAEADLMRVLGIGPSARRRLFAQDHSA